MSRKPFQGVANIVRFNWHLYVSAFALAAAFCWCGFYSAGLFKVMTLTTGAAIALSTIVSLLVSFYVYDCGSFYSLEWLDKIIKNEGGHILNIHAGFDETSVQLQAKYYNSRLTVFDFYDAEKHTEISISRARKAYPAYENTISVSTKNLHLENKTANYILLIFAAHEIRNDQERSAFFKQLGNALLPGGCIIVTEHLRDSCNLLAYNLGCLHFLPLNAWQKTFVNADLSIRDQFKHTAFTTTFILEKNGIAN